MLMSAKVLREFCKCCGETQPMHRRSFFYFNIIYEKQTGRLRVEREKSMVDFLGVNVNGGGGRVLYGEVTAFACHGITTSHALKSLITQTSHLSPT